VEATRYLRDLPEGWTWEGPLAPYAAWLGEAFMTNPEDDLLPTGCTDSTWILHTQYFCPPELELPEAWDDDEAWPGFDFGTHPPDGWERLTWADSASQKGTRLKGPTFDGREVPPCFRWEAALGREDVVNGVPVRTLAPTEGSLGKGDLETLIPILAAHTSSPRMHGAYSLCDTGAQLVDGTPLAVAFDLATMLTAMLSKNNTQFTPEFWWPQDRSWVVWTDWDLEGTKVFGSNSLIQHLRQHPKIEPLDWSRKAAA
jgi:hypothetical protein